MKKLFVLIIFSCLMISNAMAVSNDKISLAFNKNMFLYAPKGFNTETVDAQDVKRTLLNLDKYTNEKNIEGVKSIYSSDFHSDDGYGYDSYMKMVEETFSAYADIKYENRIKNISVTQDWAIVQISDKTTATLINNNFDDSNGELVGYCDYTLYLKKYDDEWKIVSDHVDYEEIALKYGEAKNYKMDFVVPLFVKKGKDYDITLKMEPPKGTFVLASLAKENVVYPPQKPKEAFRKLPNEGVLERVIHSNSQGFNEYASASIGFTKLSVEEDDVTRIKFKMSGMAFIMKRVNIISDTPKTSESSKQAQK